MCFRDLCHEKWKRDVNSTLEHLIVLRCKSCPVIQKNHFPLGSWITTTEANSTNPWNFWQIPQSPAQIYVLKSKPAEWKQVQHRKTVFTNKNNSLKSTPDYFLKYNTQEVETVLHRVKPHGGPLVWRQAKNRRQTQGTLTRWLRPDLSQELREKGEI